MLNEITIDTGAKRHLRQGLRQQSTVVSYVQPASSIQRNTRWKETDGKCEDDRTVGQ